MFAQEPDDGHPAPSGDAAPDEDRDAADAPVDAPVDALVGKTRLRTCIVTRESHDPATMIRFVRTPEGGVIADFAAKLPGRGAWVFADAGVIAKAAGKGFFARALKGAARIDAGPEAFVADVRGGLERRILSGFGLARRSGDAAIGFEKAHSLLKAGKAALVLSAEDAAADGADKLSRLAGHLDTPAARVFTVEALAMAVGFEGARHMAIAHGGHGVRALTDLRRLAGFRPVFEATRATGATND